MDRSGSEWIRKDRSGSEGDRSGSEVIGEDRRGSEGIGVDRRLEVRGGGLLRSFFRCRLNLTIDRVSKGTEKPARAVRVSEVK